MATAGAVFHLDCMPRESSVTSHCNVRLCLCNETSRKKRSHPWQVLQVNKLTGAKQIPWWLQSIVTLLPLSNLLRTSMTPTVIPTVAFWYSFSWDDMIGDREVAGANGTR